MNGIAVSATIALAVSAFAVASHAATLNLQADKATYVVGETIHLSLTSDSEGELLD